MVLPDGRLWILGGAGRNTVLDTTEYVSYDLNTRRWKVKTGPKLPVPMMGHCAAVISIDEVLVNGGLTIADTEDYTSNTFVYNIKYGIPMILKKCIPIKRCVIFQNGRMVQS